ncbi:hypothetical protein [Haloechinothrix sp. LS1_15]|uniref:hypothetical protein n=1 Tax=Haloechinothrix sp. LS1_15 TaxID=2652248 RepID=UPI00294567D3|nr:hypothetical protein [Haloechinothrix sp. LS1_15]MDV6011282.1 hypothetical protein [Haloechinothrix sp. LS1_15]
MTTPRDPQDPQDPWNQQHQRPDLPPAPQANPGEYQALPRPKSVDTAFTAWLVGVALVVVQTLLTPLVSEDLMDELGAPEGFAMEGAAGAGETAGLILTLVLAAIFAVFAYLMRGGANWARIVLTVLGGLGLLFGLFGLITLQVYFAIGFLGSLIGVMSLAQLAVTIVAIVFMYRTDANDYFRYS